ncbi:MAG: Na+/H+ antiporter NhaC family protein [Selenomonadaceae bacterium]|nr:Na+/H+ antiporter NhaC family protein [Selenomonadaceae bacterium]MBP3723235.1 Na+/H+ antiporter NhaC family protein [Selenomonadaceae bacterium]
MEQTIFSVLPPLIAIILALITKEVYMSLIVGVFSGAMIYAHFNPLSAIVIMFEVMAQKIGSNQNILIFIVILGILVAAISRSGATRAYGDLAREKIKNKRSSMFLTALLGLVIFIDDYFNCLTVGTVMRPITDKFKIARTKLAYIIDATAAPICIVAPVSSWAAAVSSSLPENSKIDGFALFLETIPYNIYAWLTLVFLAFIIYTGKDFATMRQSVIENQTEFKVPQEYQDTELASVAGDGKGKVIDLVLPLFVLIVMCIYSMLYTGGIHEGASVADAFANCDASKALVIGSFIAFVFTGFLYLPRKIVTFNAFCDSFSAGFKAMTPAIFILCLAWTLSGICSDKYLNLGGFVGSVVANNTAFIMLLPPMFFLIAIALAFSTGTSWGTFGILIPIAIAILGTDNTSLLAINVAAILSGAVGGDHASPISDTTILSSAGAQCHHLDHVNTQFPYVLTVATCSFLGYVISGLTQNGWLGLFSAFVFLSVAMIYIYMKMPPLGMTNDE